MVQKPKRDINTEWQINLPDCFSLTVTLALNLRPCAPWNWRKGEVVFRKSVRTLVAIGQFISPLLSKALAGLQLLQMVSPSLHFSHTHDWYGWLGNQTTQPCDEFLIWNYVLFKCQCAHFSSPHWGNNPQEGKNHSLYLLETNSIVPVRSALHRVRSTVYYIVQQFYNDFNTYAALIKSDLSMFCI